MQNPSRTGKADPGDLLRHGCRVGRVGCHCGLRRFGSRRIARPVVFLLEGGVIRRRMRQVNRKPDRRHRWQEAGTAGIAVFWRMTIAACGVSGVPCRLLLRAGGLQLDEPGPLFHVSPLSPPIIAKSARHGPPDRNAASPSASRARALSSTSASFANTLRRPGAARDFGSRRNARPVVFLLEGGVIRRRMRQDNLKLDRRQRKIAEI